MAKKEMWLKKKIECRKCGATEGLLEDRGWSYYKRILCWRCYRKDEFTFVWVIAGFVWIPIGIAIWVSSLFLGFDFGQGFILMVGLLALAYYLCRKAYINQPHKESDFE